LANRHRQSTQEAKQYRNQIKWTRKVARGGDGGCKITELQLLSLREEKNCDGNSVDDDNDDEMIKILVILFLQPEETHNKVYKDQAAALSV
jgi:hypothetical protein